MWSAFGLLLLSYIQIINGWSAVTAPDLYFLPLTCIKSRVAYCKKTVNFGRVIGNDSVIIAVPLSSGVFHSDSC